MRSTHGFCKALQLREPGSGFLLALLSTFVSGGWGSGFIGFKIWVVNGWGLGGEPPLLILGVNMKCDLGFEHQARPHTRPSP